MPLARTHRWSDSAMQKRLAVQDIAVCCIDCPCAEVSFTVDNLSLIYCTVHASFVPALTPFLHNKKHARNLLHTALVSNQSRISILLFFVCVEAQTIELYVLLLLLSLLCIFDSKHHRKKHIKANVYRRVHREKESVSKKHNLRQNKGQ